MSKYFKWKVLLIIAVVVTALWKIYPQDTWHTFPRTDRIHLGLDLQGGMHLVLRVDLAEIPEAAKEGATDRALEVIRNRIDEFGVREPTIARQGRDQIIVQLPGVTDHKRAKEIIGKAAMLEFRLVAHDPDLIAQSEESGEAPEGYEWLTLKDDAKPETVLVSKEVKLSGEHLVNADVQFDQSSFGQPVVGINFDSEGGKTFADITSRAASDFRRDGKIRRLAIVLDGELRTAPQMKEAIYGGSAVITGSFSIEEASDTALMLRAGALPAPVVIEEERTVGPTLGHDSIRTSIRAIIIGGLFVVFFIGIYYLLAGLIAVGALLLNVVLVMGALAMFGASLTLPGIAGIILTIGMAVDANVLIFERIREELKLGKAIRSAISSGYANAASAIWDSNITTFVTAFILFYFGTGPIRGFAVTLSVGIVSSVFTALLVTRVIFDFITRGGRDIQLKMFHFFGETHFDFIKLRKISYTASIALLVIGIFFFVRRGEANYGIDFTGGALQHVKFTGSISSNDIRVGFEDTGVANVQIQNFGDPGDHEFIIKTSEDEVDTVEEVLKQSIGEGKYEILRIETVGPAVGSQLRGKAIKTFLWALGAILLYIWWRFKLTYAVAAIAALFHDVLVTAVVYSMTGREFSLPIVAALLTIVGYSLNDTIVVFDRIREDVKSMRRSPFIEVANNGINYTISRTLLTSLTTLLVVAALYFFGGQVINDFAFTLLVGIVVGTYSSIFIASPIVVDWLNAKQGSKARR